jgi:hypothetical protein
MRVAEITWRENFAWQFGAGLLAGLRKARFDDDNVVQRALGNLALNVINQRKYTLTPFARHVPQQILKRTQFSLQLLNLGLGGDEGHGRNLSDYDIVTDIACGKAMRNQQFH